MWDFVFMPGLGPGAPCITSTVVSRPEVYEKMPRLELTSAVTYPEGLKKEE